MSEFTSEWKETKVVLSVEEFDKYREMEKAIKERKVFRYWSDNGSFYGKLIEFLAIEESEVINELLETIKELNEKNADLKIKVRDIQLNNKKTEKSSAWWK